MTRFLSLCFRLLVFSGITSTLAQNAPFRIAGDSRVIPEDFSLSVFADSLNFPVGMALLPDSSVLVAVSNGFSFFGSSSGTLIQLTDADGNGVAEKTTVVVDNLPFGKVSSLFIIDDLLLTTGQGE